MAQLSDDCFAFGGPMMSVDEAVGLIAARVSAVPDIEHVSLAEADGRILAGDLVVVEGFKSEPHRKIEVHRLANGKPLLFPDDPAIAGIATDGSVETALPLAHLDDIPAIAAMMQRSAIPVADVLAKSPIET